MITGTVMFFDPAKGFGIITPDDGSAKVAVDNSSLRLCGLNRLNEGDRVSYVLATGVRTKRPKAISLIIVKPARGLRPPSTNYFSSNSAGQSLRKQIDPKPAASKRGTVLWFDAARGFGFIKPDEEAGDVFIHISAVERAGLQKLIAGQLIMYNTAYDARSGRVAVDMLHLVANK